MRERFTRGQSVRVVRRCVLANRVPKNSKGYTHAVLASEEGDKYTGDGVIDVGTPAVVIDYASHGTGTKDVPLVRIKGRVAVCHERLIEAV